MSFIAIIIWPLVVVFIASVAYVAFDDWLKYERKKVNAQDERITELDRQIVKTNLELFKMREANAEVYKQHEDVKRIVTQHNLKQAFGPKV